MLKLSQIKKHVYTHAEIIGNGYPEQWSKAQAIATHLAALQEKVLPTLPCLHRSLPADYIQLQEFVGGHDMKNTYRKRNSTFRTQNGIFRTEGANMLCRVKNKSEICRENQSL